MALDVNALNPLSYLGINEPIPIPLIVSTIDPTAEFYSPALGTVWLNRTNQRVYMLTNKELNIATWKEFAADVVGLETLTGDNPEAVSPDNGNINIFGEGIVTVNGDDATHTLTISVNGNVATQYDADAGSAVPAANILNIFGGNNIGTSGAGNTITLNLTGTTNHAVQVGNATGSLTSLAVGATGRLLTGNTGADPSWELIGTNSGLTANSVVLANGNSPFTALGAATNGQIPIGRTGNTPVLNTLTAGTGISIVNGPGTITINATASPSYEEGSFAPNLIWDPFVVAPSYTTQTGHYIRVGDMVQIFALVKFSSFGSVSSPTASQLKITNLPVSSGAISSLFLQSLQESGKPDVTFRRFYGEVIGTVASFYNIQAPQAPVTRSQTTGGISGNSYIFNFTYRLA